MNEFAEFVTDQIGETAMLDIDATGIEEINGEVRSNKINQSRLTEELHLV